MNIKVRSILEHMLEDALDASKFIEGFSNADTFSADKLYRKAVIMSILNIGELAKNLPNEFKAAHIEIPWRKIIDMRNIAAHGYHVMDDDIIWDVVKHFMPDLISFIKKQLSIAPPLG